MIKKFYKKKVVNSKYCAISSVTSLHIDNFKMQERTFVKSLTHYFKKDIIGKVLNSKENCLLFNKLFVCSMQMLACIKHTKSNPNQEGGKEMALAFDMQKNAEQVEKLKKIIEAHKDDQGAVMPVLHAAQEMFGYLPIEIQKMISESLNVPLAEVYGVATFYSRFSLMPKGQYVIGVCLGTACYVKGAQGIIDNVKKALNLEVGQTTKDLKFSLEATRCIGACGLAPVMTINEDVYGKLLASDVPDILKKYL